MRARFLKGSGVAVRMPYLKGDNLESRLPLELGRADHPFVKKAEEILDVIDMAGRVLTKLGVSDLADRHVVWGDVLADRWYGYSNFLVEGAGGIVNVDPINMRSLKVYMDQAKAGNPDDPRSFFPGYDRDGLERSLRNAQEQRQQAAGKGQPVERADLRIQVIQALLRTLSAGLEEERAGPALDLLAEAATEDGVVVIGPEALEANAGLEELVKRAPPALARRMVLFGAGAALARARAANPAVRAVESGEVSDLAAFLIALPEAERVAVLGAALLADQLRQILPVQVNLLPNEAALRFILAAAGVVQEALDRVDWGALQQFLARRQSA